MRLRQRVLTGLATTGLLGPAFAYSVWYYGWGFPREAPGFVEAGTSGTWLDWCGVAAMLVIVLTIGAYRIATEKAYDNDSPNIFFSAEAGAPRILSRNTVFCRFVSTVPITLVAILYTSSQRIRFY